MAEYILQMRGITKIYPNGHIANKDVEFDLKPGEIHALVGENGAGKTTLMKILFGLEDYQEGEIKIKGQPVKINNPLDAIAHGVGMVHQHFMQIPKFSVAENVVLGIEPTKGIRFDQKEAVQMAQQVADKYGFDIRVTDTLQDLSVGIRQKVELLKALIRGVETLILDEPTAVLTPQETTELFAQLKRLREQGIAVVFISHKLEEVMELCDRVTVLRHGRSVGTEEIGNLDEMTIARMMVGRDVVLAIDKDEPKPHDRIVEVKDLVYVDGEGRRVLDGVSFSIRAGEVVGIAGVEGNGQSELSDIISGMLPVLGGSVRISGEEIKDKSIRDVRNLGVSHISEDRLKYGCALELSVKENILSSRLNKKEFRKGLFLDHKRANEFVDQCIEEYEILCYDRTEPVKMLSGGNIQKVIVAREFSGEARLILANQPTRGIDVGTTEMIRKTIIKKVREENIGALLVSSDLNEVLEVSDRLLVMRKGKIVACFKRASDVPEELLGEYMLGVRTMTPDEMGEEL